MVIVNPCSDVFISTLLSKAVEGIKHRIVNTSADVLTQSVAATSSLSSPPINTRLFGSVVLSEVQTPVAVMVYWPRPVRAQVGVTPNVFSSTVATGLDVPDCVMFAT